MVYSKSLCNSVENLKYLIPQHAKLKLLEHRTISCQHNFGVFCSSPKLATDPEVNLARDTVESKAAE